MPTGHPIRRLVRAREVERCVWAHIRRLRSSAGPVHALACERALLGALILEPAMIETMADQRPPGWFTDPRCVQVMHALICLQRCDAIAIPDVSSVLRRHGALDTVGTAWLQTLLDESPFLMEARAEVALARARLPPLGEDSLVRLAHRLLGRPRSTPLEALTPERRRRPR